ncbi:MAG: prephenate dehydratase [Candidatus Dojkabacteria bacterium]
MKTSNKKPEINNLKSSAAPIVSIQGNLGSYSHIAAKEFVKEFLNDTKFGLLERNSFDEVFADLQNHEADFIVIPIENSTHGSVYQNYDNLSKYHFTILGELYLKINFHLITHKGAKLEDIKILYTHPVGMNQIRGFLRENPKITPSEYYDTAGSVKHVKERGKKEEAAAASRFAAELYEMQILQENIHENSKNYTRFFMIGNGSSFQVENKNKTTIQFTLGEEAGSLYKSLRCFADRNISLTKIESRPIINTEWDYRFYLDIMAGEQEEKLQNAFNELKSYVREFGIIGSYRRGEYIET